MGRSRSRSRSRSPPRRRQSPSRSRSPSPRRARSRSPPHPAVTARRCDAACMHWAPCLHRQGTSVQRCRTFLAWIRACPKYFPRRSSKRRKCLENNSVKFHLYKRFVDDVDGAISKIKPGYVYNKSTKRLEYKQEIEMEKL